MSDLKTLNPCLECCDLLSLQSLIIAHLDSDWSSVIGNPVKL